MKIHTFFLLLLGTTNLLAQQPPRSQALRECGQVKELAEHIASLKNMGATKGNINQVILMSSDGQGIMGDMAMILYDKHKKGNSPDKFSLSMYQRCMRSNGY